MEDFKGLIDWAISQRQSIKLTLQNMTYISNWLTGYHDIRATSDLAPGLIGRSVASRDISAVGKALMELVERITHYYSNCSSLSGCAAHFNAEAASLTAALELIERDAVLVHFTQNEPFHPENFEILIPIIKSADFINKSKLRNIHWNLYRAESFYSNCCVMICTAKLVERNGTEKIIFGFGAATGINASTDAAAKALLECVQNLPILLSEVTYNSVSFNTFLSLKTVKPEHHGFLGLDGEYVKRIKHYFPTAKRPKFRKETTKFKLSDFTFHFIGLPGVDPEKPDRSACLSC